MVAHDCQCVLLLLYGDRPSEYLDVFYPLVRAQGEMVSMVVALRGPTSQLIVVICCAVTMQLTVV